MKLGFCSAILPDLNLAEVFQFASAESFGCVELMCWPTGKAERKYAGVTHLDVTGLNKQKAVAVNDLVNKSGVSISALGYYPNILDSNTENSRACADHLKRVIEAARILELDIVNTFIGANHTENIEDNFSRFTEVWPDLVSFATDHEIKLCIENCPMLFTFDEWPAGKNLAYSPAIWRRMFEAIPSPNFGLNYDPSHMVWQFMDYIQPIYEFKDRIFHIHIKDIRVEYEQLSDQGILALGWSTPKIPGYGDIEWNRFFSALTDINYNGAACIEIEDEAFTADLSARKKSLIISRNILQKHFAD